MAQPMAPTVLRISMPSWLQRSLAARASSMSLLPSLLVKLPRLSYSGPSPWTPLNGPSLMVYILLQGIVHAKQPLPLTLYSAASLSPLTSEACSKVPCV